MTHHVTTREAAGAVRSGLFAGYSAPTGSYDETFAGDGEPRPHWRKVVQTLEDMGQGELAHCWQQARRMIHENGVTYNVYDDARGMERPWELDPLPWVIGPAEWACLEAALAQRARLLNAMLADVYGPQRLLAEGLLPPELVFAHPGFLRPCHGLTVPNDCYMHVYAADLARTPDGHWWVLADRAQSPAGSGYALENRQVLSSILPEALRDCQVQRLASYFAALRQTLHDVATRHRDNPRIVLLTPGPYNETYFEHAYLARYLGYTLVEGGDLAVRDERVYLKTLAGLQPVDVILRRLDDTFCDPLELNQASLLGTAGLLQAVRAGNVSVVNALGSGWLESAALMPFLPALCRRLLDEELALPSAPTWWCGDADSLAYVLDHVEELVVMPMRSGAGRDMVRGERLSRDERRKMVDMVRARPCEYAAQQHLPLSSLPVWNGVGVQPRQTVLRTYAVAARDTYKVMSGGLTRVSANDGPPVISMQSDSGSKDTWVLCEGEPDTLTLLPPAGQPIALRRSGYDFPSRAADNLFWIGRHSERAEGLVRLLRSLLIRLNDESGLKSSTAFPVLFRAAQTWGFGHLTMPGNQPDDLASRAAALFTILFDPQAAHSVRAILGTLHRVAATVRDYMTLESWRIITHLDEDFNRPPLANHVERLPDALALIDHTIMMLSAFSGLMEENMIRGPEWHFLDLGRRLERAAHTTGLLRSTLVDADDREGSILEALLEIGDSSITYRSRYLTTLQCVPVLDLLLTDDSNPRAVVYQLVRLADHVERLPRDRAMPSLSPAQRRVMAMLTRLRLAEVEVLCQIGRNGRRGHLETALAELQADFSGLSDTITHRYLSHAELTRHLALTGG